MKRFLILLAVLALAVTPALADEPLSLLPAVNDYAQAGYPDVPADSWFAQGAQVCYETGLITGTDAGFSPELTLSGGQLAAIAARLREAVVGDEIAPAGEGQAWYQGYVDYLTAAGITVPEPEAPATRLEFAQLLCAVTPESYTPAINAITALPDCDDPQVLRLYNAGVLTGSDAYGTFSPNSTLCRHECAAMVARVVRPDLRKTVTLETKPTPDQPLSYEEEFLRTEAVRINGQSIPFSAYLDALNETIFRTDVELYANSGKRLDWDATYSDVPDLAAYFKDAAMAQVIQDYLISSQAARLGCAAEELPKTLFPDPSAVLDQVYYAKHILVADLTTAQVLLQELMQDPSVETFDKLMKQHTTDPGINSNPYGYLFVAGDMVESFESAVKSLPIGNCTSEPVPSQHGFHIILRLDPRDYPDWENSVRNLLYSRVVEDWMSSATVTPNSVELGKLDVRGRYEQYLEETGL